MIGNRFEKSIFVTYSDVFQTHILEKTEMKLTLLVDNIQNLKKYFITKKQFKYSFLRYASDSAPRVALKLSHLSCPLIEAMEVFALIKFIEIRVLNWHVFLKHDQSFEISKETKTGLGKKWCLYIWQFVK